MNNAGSAEISAFEDYPSAEGFRKSVVNFSCLLKLSPVLKIEIQVSLS